MRPTNTPTALSLAVALAGGTLIAVGETTTAALTDEAAHATAQSAIAFAAAQQEALAREAEFALADAASIDGAPLDLTGLRTAAETLREHLAAGTATASDAEEL
ncbi:hypothetical protein [Microbacterium enclense]|uniref:hypothetical protein n=1 Tax=Microbacterium enclense TaxID=993073 RepID=UPI003D749131